MSRRIRRPAALALLAAAVLAGSGAGIAGNALSGGTPGSDDRRPGTATSPPSASDDPLLGGDDLLATTDFAAIGWPDLEIDTLANGNPQSVYTCQRTSLGGLADPNGVVSVSWRSASGPTAAESAAQTATAPQARRAFSVLSGWYRTCTDGAGRRADSTLVASVEDGRRVAEVWRIGEAAPDRAIYGVAVRAGDRIAMVDLYGDVTPVEPDGLEQLATQAMERLG